MVFAIDKRSVGVEINVKEREFVFVPDEEESRGGGSEGPDGGLRT